MKGWCLRDKTLHRKALLDGISKVEDSLDVVKMVRNGRALTTLLRLLLSHDERRFIRLQRRHSVLEPLVKSSDEDKISDNTLMRWNEAKNTLPASEFE